MDYYFQFDLNFFVKIFGSISPSVSFISSGWFRVVAGLFELNSWLIKPSLFGTLVQSNY